MRRLILLCAIIIAYKLVNSQVINKPDYVDSIIKSQDLLFVEDISLNKFFIKVENKRRLITDQIMLDKLGKYDKKVAGFNELDDYKTIDYFYNNSIISIIDLGNKYFKSFDILDSSITIEPCGFKIGRNILNYEKCLPKTCSLIKNTSPNIKKYFLITIRSRNDQSWLSSDMVFYVEKNPQEICIATADFFNFAQIFGHSS